MIRVPLAAALVSTLVLGSILTLDIHAAESRGELLAQAPAPAPVASAEADVLLEAKVTAVTGNIQIRLAPEHAWQPATVGMVLGRGAEIRTGLRSAVQLKIEPGHMITIDRMSAVKLLTLVKQKELIKTDVGMKYGRSEYQIQAGAAEHDARVHSPSSTLAIRGSRVIITDDALGAHATGEGKLTYLNNLRRTAVAFGSDSGKATVTQDRSNAASVAVAFSTLDPLGAFVARTLAEGDQVEAEPGIGGSDYQAVVDLQQLAKSLNQSGIGVPQLPGPLDFSLVWFAGGASNLNLSVTDPNGNTASASNPVAGVAPLQGLFNPPSGVGDDGTSGNGFEEVRYLEFFKRGTYTVTVTNVAGADATFFINAQQGINAVPLNVSPTPPATLSQGQQVTVTVNTK